MSFRAKGSCHRQPGPKDPTRATPVNAAAPEPADVRGKSLLDKVPVQNHPGPRVSCAGLKVPAAAIPKLSVSCSSLSQSCCPSFYSPRAPFSASLVPEVPAKATLVQEDLLHQVCPQFSCFIHKYITPLCLLKYLKYKIHKIYCFNRETYNPEILTIRSRGVVLLI